jgi:hypothetical protein
MRSTIPAAHYVTPITTRSAWLAPGRCLHRPRQHPYGERFPACWIRQFRTRDGVELDQQVRPASGGAQAPGPRFGRGCEGESRPVPGRRCGSFPVALGFGPGTAVPDGVPLLVGHRQAPRRRRVAGGRGGQVAGQPRVDRPDPGELSRPVGQPSRVTRPASPPGAAPPAGLTARAAAPSGWGRESLPRSRSRKARASRQVLPCS